MRNKNILVLYAEVMPYNVVAFEAFIREHENFNLHVVCWGESKKITSYQEPANQNIKYYKEENLNLKELHSLYNDIKPELVLVSGRMEKKYLKIAKIAKKDKIIVVGNSDNQYLGSFKNIISILFSKFLYHQYFDFMQVPGLLQYKFCRKLGFKKEKIIFPQYTADVKLFEKEYQNTIETRKYKHILFIGRLEKIKGIDILIKVHKELYESNLISEKLIVVGSGSLEKKLNFNYSGVEYHTFMSQLDIVKLLNKIKYFCLPSLYEPWGVVIHEAVAAGLPIITTNICGAATGFVENDKNGYVIIPNSENDLKEALLKMTNKSDEEIRQMGKLSYDFSKKIIPEMWGNSLIDLLNKK